MPRFVVLTHDHPFLHWDLMLEQGDSLRTWRLKKPPDSKGSIVAEALPDHRLTYLDYEGPVSGGRGTVERWDAGEYEVIASMPDRVVVHLHGRRLEGAASLDRSDTDVTWKFRWVYPCPCCGYLTLGERGGYEICAVCFWEDDGQSDVDADVVFGGPNRDLSLSQARQNFRTFGASDRSRLHHVRKPRNDEIPPSIPRDA
jgi:hypothetical protein